MLIKTKLPRGKGVDEPLYHENHKRPVSRRDFIGTGLMTGSAVIAVPSLVSAAVSNDFRTLATGPVGTGCALASGAATTGGKIPFIAFDLAGGANLVGSEALVGKAGGPLDLLSTAGYGRLGLPGNMVPTAAGANVSTAIGLPWHTDGAILRGILEKTTPATQALTNGAVIAARSENDTGNNPHNPLYGVARMGAKGSLLTLIGSQSTVSGGNSAAPAALVDAALRPTKVDRAADVRGLVDTSALQALFTNPLDAVDVLEYMARVSGGVTPGTVGGQLQSIATKSAMDADIKYGLRCGYVKSAFNASEFGNPAQLDADADTRINGGIFTAAEYTADAEFRKTAAVMKTVLTGFAAAGTITMGGYDYHDGTRATGEVRNLRAGRCIGAVLEFARILNRPVMIYVFSDGSVSSTNTADNSTNGRGKFGWQGDNQATSASLMIVFDPRERPTMVQQQIGFYKADGTVETTSSAAANAVNLLANTVVLNYAALHGQVGVFDTTFVGPVAHGLGNAAALQKLTAFAPLKSVGPTGEVI